MKQKVKTKTKAVEIPQETAPETISRPAKPRIAPEQRDRAKTVRKRVRTLDLETDQALLAMSELLYEVYSSGWVNSWGFKDFKDYAAAELRCGSRKAYYLVQIWEAVLKIGDSLDRESLFALGWTKVKELVHIMTAENAAEMIASAQDMSSRDVVDMVRRVTQRPEKGSITTFTFRVGPDDARIIQDALSVARDALGIDDIGALLTSICLGWMESDHSSPAHAPLSRVVTWIEQTYGVTVGVSTGTDDDVDHDSEDLDSDDDEDDYPLGSVENVLGYPGK